MVRISILIAVVSSVFFLSACVKVEPWQKGNFTKSHMAFDPDSANAKFRQHVYESKEGSSGGYGVSGGGCGCN